MEHVEPAHEKAASERLLATAAETFGDTAEYAYVKEGMVYILSFEEAMEICGKHIAAQPEEVAMGMLAAMHERAVAFRTQSQNEALPEAVREQFGQRYEAGKERGRQALAHRALQAEA